MMISRRGLFSGVAALLAAPAIVRFESLMPVKAIVPYAPAGVTATDWRLLAAEQWGPVYIHNGKLYFPLSGDPDMHRITINDHLNHLPVLKVA